MISLILLKKRLKNKDYPFNYFYNPTEIQLIIYLQYLFFEKFQIKFPLSIKEKSKVNN